MRVQLSPHLSSRDAAISGYRISPQSTYNIPILAKSTLGTRVNYLQILDDGKQPVQSHPPNLLPINFCHNPGQYNKLLITNGKKISANYEQSKESGIPTVEFLNNQVHRNNQEKQNKAKEVYRIKQEQRQKSGTVDLGDCNCCCCDNFCKVCNEEMHVNFENQEVERYVETWGGTRSQRMTRSPARKVIKIDCVKKEINPSRTLKKQKSPKQKLSGQFQNSDGEDYERIKPLLQKSLEKQKILEHERSLKDSYNVAKHKKERIKQYDSQRKLMSRNSVIKDSKPRSPWNYNVIKQKPQVDKYCHGHQHHKSQTLVRAKKTIKKQQDDVPCHPVGIQNKVQIEELRRYYGDKAMSKVSKERERKIQQRIRLTQNLRKLEKQRKEILGRTVKEKFKPTSHEIETAFGEK